MGTYLNITAADREAFKQAQIDMIEAWGKDCTLILPPILEECPNSYPDVITGKDSGQYKPGGPILFDPGQVCPVCAGEGFVKTEVKRTVRMMVAWSPAHFFKKPPHNVQVPDGVIQTKVRITYLADLLQAQKLIIPPLNQAYVPDGEVGDPGNIVPGQFLIRQWVRA